jgi:hypothetical protein
LVVFPFHSNLPLSIVMLISLMMAGFTFNPSDGSSGGELGRILLLLPPSADYSPLSFTVITPLFDGRGATLIHPHADQKSWDASADAYHFPSLCALNLFLVRLTQKRRRRRSHVTPGSQSQTDQVKRVKVQLSPGAGSRPAGGRHLVDGADSGPADGWAVPPDVRRPNPIKNKCTN